MQPACVKGYMAFAFYEIVPIRFVAITWLDICQ